MKVFNKIIQAVVLLALIGGLAFYFEDDLKLAQKNLSKIISQCDKPIAYSIGDFDSKFGLSQEDFLKAIEQAAEIWRAPINKRLFAYAPSRGMKINLIYDSRQAATDKLKELGIGISNNKATYENLKSKYSSFDKSYQNQKTELDNIIKYYEGQKANYEDEVKTVNRRGGASADEFAILEQERIELNISAATIKEKQAAINKTVDDLNAIAKVINRLIRQLNLNVTSYNTIGANSAGEFQEGQYMSDAAGERINIYQFDDRQALVRVLAHELGHALGIDHLDNPKAIMYRLNESGSETITADDIAALKTFCQIK